MAPKSPTDPFAILRRMEDGYRKIKQVVIVLVGMAVLNVVLNLLAGQAYIGPVIRLVITLIFGLLLFQANNIVRWLVVISAGLGVIFGVIGYFGLAGQIGYFHWLSLWVLAFAAVNGWIVGVLAFSLDVHEYFE